MITIATFSKPEEAHLFRTRLGAAGIEAFVLDEHVIQIDWLLSNALGGVRVQVGDSDVGEVRDFLLADSPQPCPGALDVICPSCGSSHTAPDEFPRRLAFFSMLAFYLPLIFVALFIDRRRWVCSACRHVFRVVPSKS